MGANGWPVEKGPHIGNAVMAGDIFPMVVTKVWDTCGLGSVNGQVFLDGCDCLWVTDVKECLGVNPDGLLIAPGYWGWPPKINNFKRKDEKKCQNPRKSR